MTSFKGALRALKNQNRGVRASVLAVMFLGIALASIGPASAHTPDVAGSVKCTPSGLQEIDWTVHNSQTGEGQDMTIVSSPVSQGTVVGLPSSVEPDGTVPATTTLPGSATGTVILTINGHWAYDDFSKASSSAPVRLGGVCGTIVVNKVDAQSERRLLLSGATFGLFNSPAASGVPLAHCTTTGGTCSFSVFPGTYWVKELIPPAGYLADLTVRKIVVSKGQHRTTTFADVRIHPGLAIVKTAVHLAHQGDSVTYHFTVTNTGNITLTGIKVTDDKLGAIGTISSLTPGSSVSLSHLFTVPIGAGVDNTATACAPFAQSEEDICASDEHHLTTIHPAIEVEKSAATVAHEGDKVTYSFAVTNTGDTMLVGINVTDDKLGAIGSVSSLAAGASTTLTKDFTVPAGSGVDNTATACGFDRLEVRVCDTDQHHLVVVHGAITVMKSGPAIAHTGDQVTYSFLVINTGDSTLTNVKVTDDKLGDISTIDSLGVGASQTLTKTFTVPVAAAVDNVATACGADQAGQQQCSTDSHHLAILHPAITVTKSGPASAVAGSTVTYTFLVVNNGDATLTNIKVTDDKLGDIGTIFTLAAGASQTLTKSFLVPAGVLSVDNAGMACGVDALAQQVCWTDHHHLSVTQVLGQQIRRPVTTTTAPATAVLGARIVRLPRTGAPLTGMLLASGAVFMALLTLLYLRRRINSDQ